MSKASTAEELYPDPSTESEQPEAETPADQTETPTEAEPDISRPGAVEGQLKAAFESDKGKEYLHKLEQWSANPENFHGAGKMLSYFDTSLPMRKFRAWWDQRDRLTQWALIKGCTPPQLWLTDVGPLQALVKFGFLSYKGHHNENEEQMEQAIDKMGGMPDYLARYGVKFGKYIFPELAEIEPLVEPMLKVKGLSNKAIRNLRRSVRRHRARYELEQLKPVDVVVTTNIQSHGALEHPEIHSRRYNASRRNQGTYRRAA